MNDAQIEQFIYEGLETEMGGVKIYEKALQCVRNKELKQEWQRYHKQTQRHVEIMLDACNKLGFDPDKETPGRHIVRTLGETLCQIMDSALETGNKPQAEIVAAEAVTQAELKDHMNWQLIGLICKEADDRMKKVLLPAYEEVEDQEDEHFFHTRGWARELWAKSLGIKAVLPPPEEKMDVKTAMGAATAEQSRRAM
jgi:hypothetical protein